MLKIAIIGAGPAGLFTGYCLKKQEPGAEVTIFEEHAHLKKTCSGVLTENINKILKIPEKDKIIINKIPKAKIFAPDNEYIQIDFKKPDLVVNREKFNEYLKSLAEKQGCKIITDAKFLKLEKTEIIIEHKKKDKTTTQNISADILIGADGALSNVAKSSELWNEKERHFYLGIKAKVSIDENQVIFYPYVKDFAWIIPLKKGVCEIGLARKLKKDEKESKEMKETMHEQFVTFLKFLEIKNQRFMMAEDLQSALIPEYRKIKLHKTIKSKETILDVYLVGDAALQVKATTLGGIIPNLRAAQILAESIVKKQNYEKNLKQLNFELSMHKKARDLMSKFSDDDWNKIVDDFKDQRLVDILNETSRDEPKKLAMKLIKTKPSLIKYGRFLFK